MLNHNSAVFVHHLHENFDFSTVIGKVNQHPQDPKRWGLTNESKESWTYTKLNGDTAIIESGKNAPLATGAKINFGPVEGVIE